LFFVANDGVHGYEIWKSDGTLSGTVLLTEINVGIEGSLSSGVESGGAEIPMFVFNGQMYFTSNDQIHGDELWRTDGTSEGTIRWGPWGNAASFVTIGQTFYFTAPGVNGLEIWISDGTTNGTQLLDINQTLGNYGKGLFNVNGALYITSGPYGSVQLWKSDSTASGTTFVGSFYFIELVASLNDTLFFSAYDSGEWNLWKSDGTPAGTSKLTPGNVRPNRFAVVNGTLLFFGGAIFSNSWDLWKSDGTPGGTVVVKSINPAGGGITSMSVAIANNLLYFIADDGIDGQELWKTDGTNSGTLIVKDIAIGQASSSPGDLTSVDPLLFFSADNATGIGRELWILNVTNSTGPGVVAEPVDTASGTSPVELAFNNVITAGSTSLTTSLSPPTQAGDPVGFQLGFPEVYYNLSSTATFTGPVTVCINYGNQFSDESNLNLLHYEGGSWRDTTISLDPVNNVICGSVTSFSPFAVARPVYATKIQQPVNADGSSMFNANRGVVPLKFTLIFAGAQTCSLPPATLVLTRTDGAAPGLINESVYTGAADTGSNFRNIGCQYVYNLGSASLSPGRYRVDIKIAGEVAGSARFGLK
jgi:ELWxxDGT repeat protein